MIMLLVKSLLLAATVLFSAWGAVLSADAITQQTPLATGLSFFFNGLFLAVIVARDMEREGAFLSSVTPKE